MKYLFSLFFFAFSINLFSQNITEAEKLINAEDLIKTVEYFSSEKLDGRLSGSEGYNKAADFAAEKFKESGLLPWNNESYFDELFVEYNEIKNEPKFYLKENGNEIPYQLGDDYVFRGFTGSGNFEAEVVFAGYGLNQPEIGYDDYKNIDCKDKFVMVFKQNPDWKISGKNWDANYPREKSKIAKDHGAKGIIFISLPSDPQKPIISILHGKGKQLTDFPQIHLSSEKAEVFFKKIDLEIPEVQNRIDSTKSAFSFNTGKVCGVNVEAEYFENRATKNIAAILPGTDENLKDEIVIIGAHLDHVGRQGNKLYAPGANDNASGSAAVLHIAEAFAKSKIQNKRSIVFVLFASEEQGLFGAKHFADAYKNNSGKVVAMINLDCVGYGDSIQIGNGKSAPELWNLINEIDENNSGLMVNQTWSGGGADASPFHEIGIPAAYFVTTNSYEHLHLPSDKPESLNKNLYESLTRLAFLTAQKIADGNYQRETIIK